VDAECDKLSTVVVEPDQESVSQRAATDNFSASLSISIVSGALMVHNIRLDHLSVGQSAKVSFVDNT